MGNPEILLTNEQIQQKVDELAAAISSSYGQNTVQVLGLLDNSFIFVADLVRRITSPVICHLIKVDMHDVVENGFERRSISYSPAIEVKGRHILIVDLVLQTGVTHDHLIQQLQMKGAASVKLAVLIDKPDERRVSLQPDFSAFQLEGQFLVGYGMGFQGRYRNLPHVGTLKDVAANESRSAMTRA